MSGGPNPSLNSEILILFTCEKRVSDVSDPSKKIGLILKKFGPRP